jgi:hypothetical protein
MRSGSSPGATSGSRYAKRVEHPFGYSTGMVGVTKGYIFPGTSQGCTPPFHRPSSACQVKEVGARAAHALILRRYDHEGGRGGVGEEGNGDEARLAGGSVTPPEAVLAAADQGDGAG